MYKLPEKIIFLIYSFDSTYHQKYSQVKKEFLHVNEFWGLQFHNQSITERMSSNKMKSSYSTIIGLANYWNNEFLKATFVSIDTAQDWYNVNGVCSPSHYSDTNSWKKIWPAFKAKLSSYKFLAKKKLIN